MYYKVIDDVISEDYQKYIQSVIYDMMWAYKPTLSANTPLGEEENFVDVPGFSKVFYNQVLDGCTYALDGVKHWIQRTIQWKWSACGWINSMSWDAYIELSWITTPEI